jgi:hypothetical protein
MKGRAYFGIVLALLAFALSFLPHHRETDRSNPEDCVLCHLRKLSAGALELEDDTASTVEAQPSVDRWSAEESNGSSSGPSPRAPPA